MAVLYAVRNSEPYLVLRLHYILYKKIIHVQSLGSVWVIIKYNNLNCNYMRSGASRQCVEMCENIFNQEMSPAWEQQ